MRLSAILSDITTPKARSRALANIGIAFAICFIIGPPIGAYFASRPIPASWNTGGFELNVYAVPAFITLVLLTVETIFLAIALPETRGTVIKSDEPKETTGTSEKANGKANGHANGAAAQNVNREASVEDRIKLLRKLRLTHFLFLGLFSGVEFTLTFLTFDREYLHIFINTLPNLNLTKRTR